MLPLIRALEDGADHSVSEVREGIAREMALTEEDRAELLPSGKQSIFGKPSGGEASATPEEIPVPRSVELQPSRDCLHTRPAALTVG